MIFFPILKEELCMKKFTIAAAILLMAAAGSVYAQDNIGNQAIIAQGDARVRWTQCAFTPDGLLHVVYGTADSYAAGNGVWFVTYDGTTATTPYNVTDDPNATAMRPTITSNAQGKICVAWGDGYLNRIYCRIFNSATNTWGDIDLVDEGNGWFEPFCALDGEGNIYIVYYNEYSSGWMTNSKINGVWEGSKMIGFGRGKQGDIVAAPNGVIWSAWREKGEGGYSMWYSKRTKTTDWEEPRFVRLAAEPSHPHLACGLTDNTPYLASGEITVEDESFQEIWIMYLNETSNPLQHPAENIMQHYPVITVDAFGNLHLAIQRGGGDYGDGIQYTNNVGGTWKPVQYLPASVPKVAGIDADPFGNVAIAYSSTDTRANGKADIIVNSVYPIKPMFFEPPVNLTIAISLTSLRRTPGITYNLGWSANSKNTDSQLRGYKIYMKEGDGLWTGLTEVTAATKTATFSFSDKTKKRLFSIVTVSIGGAESKPVIFGQ
jgi:hypothetical protein